MRSSPTNRLPTVGDVFSFIRGRREVTRAEIGQFTGLSRTSVAARVSTLLESRLVDEVEQAPSTGGRPAALLSPSADSGIVASVAVGISRTRVAIHDLAGNVLSIDDIDQDVVPGPTDLMPTVLDRLDTMLAYYTGTRVFGVGLSLPGAVDRDRGCVVDCPVLRGWDGVELRPFFAKSPRFARASVVFDNDANTIAAAEISSDRVDATEVLVVKASTGLGAGIISGGLLQRGANQSAGEFGHNKIAAAKGLPCRCGDTGCLETIAGGWAIAHNLREQGRSVRHLRDVVAIAHEGDSEARRLIRESGRHVGEAVAPAVNLLNPGALIIAGDMADAYDIFVAGLRETLYGNATARATRTLEIRASAHGQVSGVVGGAVLALDEVLSAQNIDVLMAGFQLT